MPDSKSKSKTKTKQAPEPSFEDALDLLEGIVEDLEGGRMPLEELVASYEEGTRLLKRCQESLTAARQRVEAIDPTAARRGAARLTIMEETDAGENRQALPPEDQDDDAEQLF